MSALFERDCAEHIHWHPYVTVEKYSPDQTAWAEHRLEALKGWRRLPVLKRVPLGDNRATLRRHQNAGLVHDLHGDWLRELFPGGPEDGYACDDGNLLVNGGLTVIVKLLNAAGGTSYYPLQNNGATNNTVCGVGATSTAATTSDTHLGADAGSAYYLGMDATYPSVTTPATVNGQATYASGVANFAWNEWCWATGAGTVTAGATLSSVFATGASINMINHKVPVSSLGTKASGASWVFSTTIVFS